MAQIGSISLEIYPKKQANKQKNIYYILSNPALQMFHEERTAQHLLDLKDPYKA